MMLTFYLFFLKGVIGYLVDSSEPCIIEPKEYISKYTKPYDVILGSGNFRCDAI